MEKQTQSPTTLSHMQAIKAIHVTYITQQITLLDALKAHYGEEMAQVIEQTNSQHICQRYLAHLPEDHRSLDDFLTMLWEPLRQHGYDFTVEHFEHGVQMRCTACPWATLYTQLGGAEWGYRLYCAADAPLVQQFNPNITFTRTKTLMEGDDCCDHAYTLRTYSDPK